MNTAFEPATYATVFTPESQSSQSLKALQTSCPSSLEKLSFEGLDFLKTSDRRAFDHTFLTRELPEMIDKLQTQNTYSIDLSQVFFSAISFDTIQLPSCVSEKIKIGAVDSACLIAVIAARPLNELVAHLFARKVPSALLVARCVKVVALAAFTWHFYDELLLSYPDKLVHSVRGKVEVVDASERNAFKDFRPFLLETAHYYQLMAVDEAFDLCKVTKISTQTIVDMCKQNHPFFESVAALKYSFYRFFTGKLSTYEILSYLRS